MEEVNKKRGIYSGLKEEETKNMTIDLDGEHLFIVQKKLKMIDQS